MSELDLFTPAAACPATRESVEAYERAGGAGCPACGCAPDVHEPESADVVRDDRGRFDLWLLALPRRPFDTILAESRVVAGSD